MIAPTNPISPPKSRDSISFRLNFCIFKGFAGFLDHHQEPNSFRLRQALAFFVFMSELDSLNR